MKLNTINKELKLASISDIHLGHKRNKTVDIIANLKLAFPDNETTAELDIIFLAGDVFDRLLEFPDYDVPEINIWIFEFLSICSKYNIIVRVLEGTPSHDRGQSETFLTTALIANLEIDLKYIKVLSIEHIDKFDIDILYVPDEWETTTDKTLQQVKDLMQNKGLSKVDFAIMHGNFSYQMPSHLKKIPRHDEDEYLKLVRHYIFIGHIHNFSFYERIIAQGSFDRLAHGEEAPKGHVRATISEDGNKEFFFIENKTAKIYKTYKCYDLDLEQTLRLIEKEVDKLPNNANVRIEANPEHPVFSNMNQLVTLYPTITWSKLPKSNEVEEEIINDDEIDDYTPITISKDNIVSLMMQRINSLEVSSFIILKSELLLKDLI